MVAANIIAADSDAEARHLFTSLQQAFLRLRRGEPGPLPAPVASIESITSEAERAGLSQALQCSFVGSVSTVEQGVRDFLLKTGADELIVSGHIHDHQARLRSFKLAAQVRDAL
jgi:alkanesulfonate monooxygenase SsuD/methylene tetrahydromethanopterin reductase-like flavin-dependent oxidoreductase (luciferase family)